MENRKRKNLRYDRRLDVNCNSYLDEHGNYIITRDVYRSGRWEKEVVLSFRPEDDLDGAFWIETLTEFDYEEDLQEDSLRDHMDRVFQAMLNNLDETGGVNPWDEIAFQNYNQDIWSSLSLNEVPEDVRLRQLKRFLKTLLPQQRYLFYAHYGQHRTLKELRLEEMERTGKVITQQAYSNRWNAIIARACRFFDIPVPRKRNKKK